MEALQVLKYHFRQSDALNFTEGLSQEEEIKEIEKGIVLMEGLKARFLKWKEESPDAAGKLKKDITASCDECMRIDQERIKILRARQQNKVKAHQDLMKMFDNFIKDIKEESKDK